MKIMKTICIIFFACCLLYNTEAVIADNLNHNYTHHTLNDTTKKMSNEELRYELFTQEFSVLKHKTYSYKKLIKLMINKWQFMAPSSLFLVDVLDGADTYRYHYFPLGKVKKDGKEIYYMCRVTLHEKKYNYLN